MKKIKFLGIVLGLLLPMVALGAGDVVYTGNQNEYFVNHEIWFDGLQDNVFLAGIRQRDTEPGQSAAGVQLYFEGAGGGAATEALDGGAAGLTIVAGGLGGDGNETRSPGKGGYTVVRGGNAGSSGGGGAGQPNGFGGADGGAVSITGGLHAGNGKDGTVAIGEAQTDYVQIGNANIPVKFPWELWASKIYALPGTSMAIDNKGGGGIGIGSDYANQVSIGRPGNAVNFRGTVSFPHGTTLLQNEVVNPDTNYSVPVMGVERIMYDESLSDDRAIIFPASVPENTVKHYEILTKNTGKTVYVYSYKAMPNALFTLDGTGFHFVELSVSPEVTMWRVDGSSWNFL